ncbi:MAG: hypothetical protein H7A46_20905, partial [Verrucomicrobiales bacterium]|nr:hypothetical protein [Verrucomicrobiales bacterium]
MADDQASCSQRAGASNGLRGRRLRRRYVVYIAVSIVLLVLLGRWMFSPSLGPEPEVNGVPIRKWLATKAALEGPSEVNFAGVAVCGTNAIPWLVSALDSRDGRVQLAVRKLWQHLPLVVRRRWSPPRPSEEVREIAWQALRFHGEEARPWLPSILAAARTETGWRCRGLSIQALLTIARDLPEVVGLLRSRLTGPAATSQVRNQVLAAFYMVGWSPPELHSLLLSLLEAQLASDVGGSCNLLLALQTAPTEAASVLPLLTDTLKSGDLCAGNVWAIFRSLGPAAEPLVPFLREELRTGDGNEKELAVDMLWRIGPLAHQALPELRVAMSDADPGIRTVAAGAWNRAGGEPEPAVNVLEEVLRNWPEGRFWFGPESWLAWGRPQMVLNVPQTALWMLGDLGPDARSSVPLLHDLAGKSAPDYLEAL